MHSGLRFAFPQSYYLPRYLLSPDQSVYTAELSWLLLNKNDHPREEQQVSQDQKGF